MPSSARLPRFGNGLLDQERFADTFAYFDKAVGPHRAERRPGTGLRESLTWRSRSRSNKYIGLLEPCSVGARLCCVFQHFFNLTRQLQSTERHPTKVAAQTGAAFLLARGTYIPPQLQHSAALAPIHPAFLFKNCP